MPDIERSSVDTDHEIRSFLQAERYAILCRGDGRELASADDSDRLARIDALLEKLPRPLDNA